MNRFNEKLENASGINKALESIELTYEEEMQRSEIVDIIAKEYTRLVKEDPSCNLAKSCIYNLLYCPVTQGFIKPYSVEDLIGAIGVYAKTVKAREPKYKFFAATFFGKKRQFLLYVNRRDIQEKNIN